MKKKFKKTLSLILVLSLCFGLCASLNGCSFYKIKLTLDNYEDYLNIRLGLYDNSEYKFNHTIHYESLSESSIVYFLDTNDGGRQIQCVAYIEGVSSNYDYSDIEIEVEIEAIALIVDPTKAPYRLYYEDMEFQPFKCTKNINCKLDITGNGKGIVNIDNVIPEYYVAIACPEYTCNIISINGTVTR